MCDFRVLSPVFLSSPFLVPNPIKFSFSSAVFPLMEKRPSSIRQSLHISGYILQLPPCPPHMVHLGLWLSSPCALCLLLFLFPCWCQLKDFLVVLSSGFLNVCSAPASFPKFIRRNVLIEWSLCCNSGHTTDSLTYHSTHSHTTHLFACISHFYIVSQKGGEEVGWKYTVRLLGPGCNTMIAHSPWSWRYHPPPCSL